MTDTGFDDPRRPLKRALRFGVIALGVVLLLSLAIWGGKYGLPGIWAALLGSAIGGTFVLTTAFLVLATAKTDPQTTQAVVLGSWLLKLVVFLVLMWVLRPLTFYNHTAMAVTTLVALIVLLGCETWGVITSRVTYVQPEER